MLVEQLEVNEFFISNFKKQKDPVKKQTSTFTPVQGNKQGMSTSTLCFGVKGEKSSISAIYTTRRVLL